MSTETVTNEAIDRADQGTDPAWKESALQALRECATQNAEFTVDDVWKLLPTRTRENRAMGAVLRRGVKNGWIKSTGRYAPTMQEQCHRNPRTVWRSLL